MRTVISSHLFKSRTCVECLLHARQRFISAEILSLPPHRRPAKEAYCLSPLLDSLFTLEQRSVRLQGTGRCETGWNWRMQAQPQGIPTLTIVFLKIPKIKIKKSKESCLPTLFIPLPFPYPPPQGTVRDSGYTEPGTIFHTLILRSYH